MTVQIQSNNDLLNYLINQANSGSKVWFGFPQQRLAGIHLAYEIAKVHADKLTPDEIIDFVMELNNAIYGKLLRGAA
jgi:hypothetical protein